MSKKYKLAVVIGRFQIFHNGHKYLIDQALELADNVLVLVGSSNVARNIKNPFTFGERSMMIKCAFDDDTADWIVTDPIKDYLYDDDAWALQVDNTIKNSFYKFDLGIEPKDVVLVGHKKDKSSYYLNMFPQYDYFEVEKDSHINATDLREVLYKTKFGNLDEISSVIRQKVPMTTDLWLRNWIKKEKDKAYANLVEEYSFIQDYKRLWERAPYPVIFQTVDAVVVRSNYVLMVKRRASPGKGLWALPGGFLNYNEKTTDAAIRELKEETKLDIPDKILLNCIQRQKRFDHPDRSLRGRTITEAFHIQLPNGKLDRVKGMDDAEKAQWIHLNELDPKKIYEDHYSIIQYFTGI